MTIINTPLDYTEAEYFDLAEEDGTFWKQVIPMNYKLTHDGKEYLFDKAALESVKSAFKDKAVVDQTAFQLANDKNQHDTKEDLENRRHFDPKRFAGDIANMIINSRGLYAKVKATTDGAKLIADNPKLGVSASLIPNYTSKTTGKTYPLAMRHLLGTLDPKIKGMTGWSRDQLLLSNVIDEEEEVIDLTTAAIGTEIPEDKVEVDKAEYEAKMARLKEFEEGEQALDEILAEDDDEEETEPVSMSNEEEDTPDPRYIQLANKVAAAEWKAERNELVRKGVPIAMLDLAEEVLAVGDDLTINLSNEETIDGKELIRKMLHEAEGYVDLSEESGHSITSTEREKELSARDAFVDDFLNDVF